MEFFGINPAEGIVLLVIGIIILGPKQLLNFIQFFTKSREQITRIKSTLHAKAKLETQAIFADTLNATNTDKNTLQELRSETLSSLNKIEQMLGKLEKTSTDFTQPFNKKSDTTLSPTTDE